MNGEENYREEEVAAYMIVEVETTDEALMAEYRKHTPGLIAKFGGKFIVRGGKTRTLEGGWTPSRVVMIEFPDMAAAERFYDSPDYKLVLDMRLRALSLSFQCAGRREDGLPARKRQQGVGALSAAALDLARHGDRCRAAFGVGGDAARLAWA